MEQTISSNGKDNSKNEVSSLDWLCDRIYEFVESNNEKGRIVEFHGAFWIIDPEKDFDVVEDRVMAYGSKEAIQISIKEQAKMIRKETEDFINW